MEKQPWTEKNCCASVQKAAPLSLAQYCCCVFAGKGHSHSEAAAQEVEEQPAKRELSHTAVIN